MSSLFRNRAVTTLLLFCLTAFFGPGAALAQGGDIEGGNASTRKDLGGGASAGVSVSGGRSTSTKAAARERIKSSAATATKARSAAPTLTTGSLSIATTRSDVTIYVVPVGGGTPIKGVVEGGERIFIFNKLKQGKYNVYAEGKDYDSEEREITVVPNKNTPVTIDEVTYTANFTINIGEGNIRYAPAEKKTVGGEEVFEVKGKTIYEPIVNGHVRLTGLRPGTYVADILAKDPGYQPERTSFVISDNTDFPTISLKKLTSTKAFSASWSSLNGWNAPSSWRVSSRKLIVSGQGIALPTDESYRYYQDFELSADVKMVNGVAATFILHAENERNYYMIQLTGANSDEPYVLRGFVVREGRVQRLATSVPIDVFSDAMKAGQFFNVNIKMKDNNITVAITDSQTGRLQPLGVIPDPNRTFRIGAVGIGARDTEQNEIGGFAICTPECPKG